MKVENQEVEQTNCVIRRGETSNSDEKKTKNEEKCSMPLS